MKPTIIFDLDGTLIDTPRGIVETFTATLNTMGVTSCDPLAIKDTIGLPLELAFSKLLSIEQTNTQISKYVKLYQSLFIDIVLPKAKELIFPGVLESLTEFKAKNISLAVATSKVFKSAEALLKAAELWEYFDLVVGADQVTYPKPHPDMGILIMKTLCSSTDYTLMVGDTTHDLLMAKNAGIRSVAVTYGVHDIQMLKTADPTWIVDSFADILNYISILDSNDHNFLHTDINANKDNIIAA